MDILLWIITIVGGGMGIISSIGIVVYLFWTIGYKIYRKAKYGISFFN